MTMSKESSGVKLRVVFDTSVLIAAALRSNFSQILVEQARDGAVDSITSEEILAEFSASLKKKSDFSTQLIEKYVDEIRLVSQIVKPTHRLAKDSIRDQNDNKILECALEAKANLIISLDQDLSVLKAFRGIGIVHPKTLSWIIPDIFGK